MAATRRWLQLVTLGAALATASGPAPREGAREAAATPSVDAGPAAPRSHFDAPEGCRNLTVIGFPAGAFPRVLPLTHLCPFEPRSDCLGEARPQRSRLALREHRTTPRRDAVKWRLQKGQAVTPADLGDPTTDTDYELCVYVEVGGVCWLVLHPDALAGEGWSARKSGFLFKRKKGAHPDGLRSLRLRPGPERKARIALRGAGEGLGLRALPIPDDAAVLVQLYNEAGQCWSTEFGQEPLQTTPRRFRDRSDGAPAP
jgi:hypothetical protein